MKKLIEDVQSGRTSNFTLDQGGALGYGKCLCVPNLNKLKKIILEQFHNSKYTIHPSLDKMYQDLRQLYWWKSMKKDIGDFVSWCMSAS